MNNKEKATVTGTAGELYVKSLLESLGANVYLSVDKFDKEKDMVAYFGSLHFKIEVKTQAPLMKHRAFSFSENQLKKLQNVDFSVMIALAPSGEWTGKINMKSDIIGSVYKVRPNFEFRRWRDSHGAAKIMLPVEQDAFSVLKVLTKQELDELSKNTFKMY